MNNFNNYIDIDKINSQLERADIQKRILTRNIYREYELYLNLVRDLLFISVEKGLNQIYSYPTINDNFLNENEFYSLFEKKISKLIFTNLPFLTVEQLKINEIEKNIVEKQFISSLLELIGEEKVEKQRYQVKENINQMDNLPKNQILNNFDLIDKSLENLLLNLSYNINQELFKANLIKKMISKDSFDYLVGKNFMIKHPYPFVINFELNLNRSSLTGNNFPSIIFFNISTVELEFKNLNLSIQRNKINELKNQFQRLIKKETYWRQKEITLNKIR